MKRLFLMSTLCVVVLSAFALKRDPVYCEARLNGAETKIEFHIVDDDMRPVADAKVRALLGMNFREKGTWVDGATDTNGVFVLSGKTCGDEILLWLSKDGYYNSSKTICYATMGAEHEVKDGKWQPYGEIQLLRLRKINASSALILMSERKFSNTRCINKWLGYDIKAYDFVAPYGRGSVSDFEVFIDWDGKWLPDYKGMGVIIRFPEAFSGYCPINVIAESEFIGPYSASARFAYLKEASFSERMLDDGRWERNQFDQRKCWVVRTRCKVDDDGRMISANYAVVHNIELSCDQDGVAGICVIGAFNPTPNDTNLEPLRERRKRGKRKMLQR